MTEDKDYYLKQRKFWSIFAPVYDFVVWPASKIRENVVTLADAPRGSKILDVSTGTGKQAFAFAKKGYDVTGIDLSDAMLNIAKRKNKYKNLKFEVADASELPFEKHSFDVACVAFALHEMPLSVRDKVLQEMVRVTKPKGTIITIDFDRPPNKINRFLIYYFLKLFEGEHYVKYMKTELKKSINKAGIVITSEIPVLLGGVLIIKGTTPA